VATEPQTLGSGACWTGRAVSRAEILFSAL